MFAVIKTGGKQYLVQEGDVCQVEKLDIEEGKKVTFKEVLLIESEEASLIGTPFVEKAEVQAVVIENFKDKKVLVFKKKRRKQYKKLRGHRQELSSVKIEKIIAGKDRAAKKKPAKEVKEEPKQAAVKKEKSAAVKKPAVKKKTPKEKAAEQAAPKTPVKTEKTKAAKAQKTKAKTPEKKMGGKSPAKTKKVTSRKE
jgi:large subunit ribosomal protein L21